MWILNNDNNKWTSNGESLKTSDFNLLKQDLKSLRFYQRVLSGATFIRMDDVNNIYDVITRKSPKTYNYTQGLSQYVTPYFIPQENQEDIISTFSQYEYENKYLPEYGLTLKNLFTPKRLINEQTKNILYVDVASTDIISNLTSRNPGLFIDGVPLKEGHRVLIKNQYTLITILTTVNPDNYFDGKWEVYEQIGANTTYLIYNNTNGIYKYSDEKLVRDTDLDSYDDISNFSVCVKLGTVNRETQWSLQRLRNGFFPEYKLNQTMYFLEKHNYVLRNRMDYNNLYELVLNDTIKHATQSFTYEDITYTIPKRTITVGEFGVIIVDQEGRSNIIDSKYKVTLRSISETEKNYWICGDDGTLLKVRKFDLKIEKIKLLENLAPPKLGIPKDPRVYRDDGSVLTTLTSVSFFNESRGVVVGKYNQLWITDDGGYNWKRINILDFDGYNFNVVKYQFINKFYVGGDNGVFLELLYEFGNWTAYKRRISKFPELEDEYLLVDDITDLDYFSDSNANWFSGYRDFLAISTKNSNLILHDIDNSLSSDYDFVYLGNPTFSDISSIKYIPNQNSIFLSTFENILKITPLNGTFAASGSNIFNSTYTSVYTQSGVNSIYFYNTTPNSQDEVIITGNNSLWEKSPSSLFSNFSTVYDSEFFNNLKPRLLFMDYDAGSKLYWFDDYGQYRLPERYKVPVSYLVSPNAVTDTSISFRQNSNSVYDKETGTTYSYLDNNWITYWKDRLKTFEYYTHLSDGYKVEPSFTFKSSDFISGIFTYSVNDIIVSTNDNDPNYTVCQNLIPSTSNSRFRQGSVPISEPGNIHDFYFHDFLGIWRIVTGSTHSAPEKGDVLQIDCGVFSGKFIINKVYTVTSGTDNIHYQYFYTNFNENILNNLKNVQGVITVRNLNRFSTKNGGVKSFTYTSGSGYVPGSYVSIESSSSTGNSATFDIEINGARNVTSIIVNKPGYGFSNGDTITIPTTSIVGGSSDITITITDIDYNSLFLDNFKLHYISNAYSIEVINEYYPKPTSSPVGTTYSFQVTGKYSQYSAYYNLQTNVEVLNTSGYLLEDDILYQNTFLNFGYTPTYNLLSYLNYIDNSKFTPDKEFLSLPSYTNVPGPDSGIPYTNVINDNLVYFDFVMGTYSGKLETNKLFFGLNLKPLWDSFLKWTFIDLSLKEGNSWPANNDAVTHITKRLIIIDKYYDTTTYNEPYYVIVFHDKFAGNNNICSIDIKSRRKLQQISDDLQYINRLQRPYADAEGTKWSEISIEPGYSYTNYETDINFKISTDSYTKALLADSEVSNLLTGIVYTDYKYELAIQLINLKSDIELPVTGILQSVNSKYQFSFDSPHKLNDGDGIKIELVNATQSNFPKLLGYHVINYLDTTAIEIDVPFTGFTPTDNLKIVYTKADPFLNFEPVDIFDLGIGDKKVKQSIQILPENYDIAGNKYYLKNIDFNKYRFRLIDGLDLVRLTEEFFWILDAEVSEAIIGLDEKQNLVWYKGIWEGGRWFGGTWISGTWKSGDWYDGVWTSKLITDNFLNVKVDKNVSNLFNSTWYGGRWFGGTWENGTWYSGRWYDGNWKNGRWFDGTWNDGTWDNGKFTGGIWVLGKWNNGIFNTDSSLSYWLDGKFSGGDFENGFWYNGEFNQESSNKSRFGTKAFNSRNAIWYGGKFTKGEFHSFLNTNGKGLPDVSEIHKYSTWHSGVFSSGAFYGGNAYNINFNSSVWQGGILNEIDIIRIRANSEYNDFRLDGIYRFNIGDAFYIVDKFEAGTYSVFGTTENPKKYVVLDTTINEDSNTTDVFVDLQLSEIYGTTVNTGIISDSGIKCVSIFKDSTFNSGIWFNGVFDGGYYNGGMWYHGNFSGIWG